MLRRQRRAKRERDAKLGGEAAPGFLDANDPAVVVDADEPRADIDSGEVDHLAAGADRDLGGAAADVDVHHSRLVADRARDRARAIGRHHGLEIVAGRDRDHLAGLAGEQFTDLAGVAAAHCDAGEDQRAGVDLVGIDLGVTVLAFDEGAELGSVNCFLALARIGREQNVGLIEGLALCHHVAAVEPLQHDAREYEVRGRGADVDADAEDDDLVLVNERAAGRGKEDASTLRFVIHVLHPIEAL